MHPSAALYLFFHWGWMSQKQRDNTAYTVWVPNLHICFDLKFLVWPSQTQAHFPRKELIVIPSNAAGNRRKWEFHRISSSPERSRWWWVTIANIAFTRLFTTTLSIAAWKLTDEQSHRFRVFVDARASFIKVCRTKIILIMTMIKKLIVCPQHSGQHIMKLPSAQWTGVHTPTYFGVSGWSKWPQ